MWQFCSGYGPISSQFISWISVFAGGRGGWSGGDGQNLSVGQHQNKQGPEAPVSTTAGWWVLRLKQVSCRPHQSTLASLIKFLRTCFRFHTDSPVHAAIIQTTWRLHRYKIGEASARLSSWLIDMWQNVLVS